MSVVDLSSLSEQQVLDKVSATSCLVKLFKDGCPACFYYDPEFNSAADTASLLCDFYKVSAGSRGEVAIEKLVAKLGKQIEGYPTTVVMCKTCGDKAQPVASLVGARPASKLIEEAVSLCEPMRKR